MAAPNFLASSFRYLALVTVTDVQTIIDNLYSELVTNGSPAWTCTVGGVGQSPTEFKSPARADGLSFTINLTRDSATRLSWLVKDQWGVLVNNQTNTKQDIDATGTNVHLYTGEFHVGVNSSRATQEFFGCGVLDHSPDGLNNPFGSYWATMGPRNTTGVLATQGVANNFAWGGSYANRGLAGDDPILTGNCHALMTGEVLATPAELTNGSAVLIGRMHQVLCVDTYCAFDSEVTVPIDVGTTGTFRVVGLTSFCGMRLAWRRA